MSNPARSWCIAHGHLPIEQQNVVFIVPAGHTLILKDLRVWATADMATTLQLYVTDPTRSSYARIADIDCDNKAIGSWSGWVVCNAGYHVEIMAFITYAWYWLSGTLLVTTELEPIQPPSPVTALRVESPATKPNG